MDLPYWLRIAESLAVIATPILIFIGGTFAWYKFIRQGEHDPRLQPAVTGAVTVRNEMAYIVVVATVQNNGQTDVELDLELSALDVYATQAEAEEWEFLYVVEVFRGQEVAQPNETIEDQLWLEIPLDEDIAIHLELTIAEKNGPSWATSRVLSLLDGGGQPGSDE